MATGTPAPSLSDPGQVSRAYWDEATESFLGGSAGLLWRQNCDQLHERLIGRWLAGLRFQRALKTDLFDEAAGPGLAPLLMGLATEVHGVDISGGVSSAARERIPSLHVCVSDTRSLCYRAGTFDLVVSNSTLDHFAERREILQALSEIRRIMAPGGHLLITLDNPINPVVGARTVAPFDVLRKLRLVPYYVGATLGFGALRRELAAKGFEVLEGSTLMHAPRLPAMLACRLVESRGGSRLQERLLAFLEAFEALGRLPSRQLTAYYVAVLARKPS